jgi:hypothetical protein
LIPLWTPTTFQFRHVSSIFFLSSPEQLTRVTFTLSAHPVGLPESHPNSLSELHLRALPEPYPIASIITRPYTFIPGQITLPNSSPDQTSTYSALHGLTRQNYLNRSFSNRTSAYRLYMATLPNFLTRPGNTLLHPTAYPALPNHLAQPGTLQLASLKNFLIGLPH